MKSMSIGTRAESPLKRADWNSRAGFTLIEALVALAVILAFVSALAPLLAQSRTILMRGDGQVRAELFLRSLLQRPFDRRVPEIGVRHGETEGLRWQVEVEPMQADALAFDPAPDLKDQEANWALFKVTARVRSAAGQVTTAETLRLGDAGK